MKKHATGIIFEKNDKLDKHDHIFKIMFKDLSDRNFMVRFHKKQILSLRKLIKKLDCNIFKEVEYISFFSQHKLNKIYNQFDKKFFFTISYSFLDFNITLSTDFDLEKTNKISKITVCVRSYEPYNFVCFTKNNEFNVAEINKFVQNNIRMQM